MFDPKILFINPASVNRDALPIPPLGILYLAAFLREGGFTNLSVFDNNYYKADEKTLREKIIEHDIICVSGTTAQYPEAARIAKISREYNKISIAGGPHASAVPEDMINNAGFDIVVVGEGETPMLDIVGAISKGETIKNIGGIVYRDGNTITTTPPRKFIKDLDQVPFPARDLIDMSLYGNKEIKRYEGQYTHMMSSRGCGSKCTFCCSPIMWRCCRLASAKRVFDEMIHIYKTYGIKNIHFQDDNFTIHRVRAIELCNLIIDSGIGFRWSCQTRPTKVDLELLQKMKQAGCVQVEFGVESGEESILVSANKKYTKEQIKKAFDLSREVGIYTYGFFIVGLPGENLLSWIKTIIFAKQLKLNGSAWSVLLPFPGTEIYNKNLVHIIDHDYRNWTYKKPVVRVGVFGPRMLSFMRWAADRIVNGFFNTGTYKKKKLEQ